MVMKNGKEDKYTSIRVLKINHKLLKDYANNKNMTLQDLIMYMFKNETK